MDRMREIVKNGNEEKVNDEGNIHGMIKEEGKRGEKRKHMTLRTGRRTGENDDDDRLTDIYDGEEKEKILKEWKNMKEKNE